LDRAIARQRVAAVLARIGQRPVTITNGLERAYEDSVESLVRTAKALTLLTRDGAEVQVAPRRQLEDGSWEGEVLRAAVLPLALRVGTIVHFYLSSVQGGTV
jgi:hypothetical protein